EQRLGSLGAIRACNLFHEAKVGHLREARELLLTSRDLAHHSLKVLETRLDERLLELFTRRPSALEIRLLLYPRGQRDFVVSERVTGGAIGQRQRLEEPRQLVLILNPL